MLLNRFGVEASMQRALIGLAALLGGFAEELARPDAALACSAPTDSISVRDTPANGAVIVDVLCWFGSCFEGALPTELEVVDTTTGLPVPGSVVYSAGSIDDHGLVAFRPDAPLTAGRSYEVMWQPVVTSARAELDYVLEATAEVSDAVGSTTISAALEPRVDDYYETTSCMIEPFHGACGGATHNIGIKTKRYASLEATLDNNAGELANQLLLRTAFWSQGQTPPALVDVPPLLSRGQMTQRFDVEASAYCYRIEIESLVTGSISMHEDCLPHGSLGSLDMQEVNEAGRIAQMGICAMPPTGDYLSEWCTARLEQCEANVVGWMTCDDAEAMCADIAEPEPMEPSDSMDPEPNDPMDPIDPNTAGDDGAAGAAGMSGEMSEPVRTTRTACSASPGARGQASLATLLGLFALVLHTRRSRRIGDR
jgi:hypothetical protein